LISNWAKEGHSFTKSNEICHPTSGSKTTIARTRQKEASCLDENLCTRLVKFGISCTLSVSSLTASTSSASPTAANPHQQIQKIQNFPQKKKLRKKIQLQFFFHMQFAETAQFNSIQFLHITITMANC
jgi:hypothetical protein